MGSDGITDFYSQLRINNIIELSVDTPPPPGASMLMINPDGSVARLGGGLDHPFPFTPNPCKQDNNGNTIPYWDNDIHKIYTVCEPVKVGIGTEFPAKKLDVQGYTYTDGLSVNTMDEVATATIKSHSSGLGFEVQDENGIEALSVYGDGMVYVGHGHYNGSNGTASLFLGHWTQNIKSHYQKGISITSGGSSGSDALFIQENTGKVGIGVGIDHTFGEGLLEVNGTIRGRKVVVELTGWPDYVFDDEYEVMPLAKLQEYIKENNHLPGIPSAGEIEKEGLDLGDVVKLQMEKIEELTLYLIELERKVEELKGELKQ